MTRNAEALKTEIQNVISERHSTMTGKQIRKQYAPGKAQIATLTELGIIGLMPAGFGFTDAAAVIGAATSGATGVMNRYGEGEEIGASKLYALLHAPVEAEEAETFVLSDVEPHQTMTAGGGTQDGDEFTVWQEDDGTWSGCFHGVADGLYYESDDLTGYATKAEAVAALRDAAAEMSEE